MSNLWPEMQSAFNDGICSRLGIVNVLAQSEINSISCFPMRKVSSSSV